MDAAPSGVATTAARALAIGASLTAPQALDGLSGDLEAIGMYGMPKPWGGWPERLKIIEASNEVLARHRVLRDVLDREQGGWVPTGDDPAIPERIARVDLWREVADGARQPTAVAWLRTLMTDREPVAAAAAAAALSNWRRIRAVPAPMALEASLYLTERYADSDVLEAREIARSALGMDRDNADQGGNPTARAPKRLEKRRSSAATDSVSIIVHGTAAWTGTWWFPGGDFHTYVRACVRHDLFSGQDAFSWSGAYKGKHRRVAAKRLAGWSAAVVGTPLNTVFAHSYGGTIALHATTYGLEMSELVLMSVPAEPVAVEWRNIGRVTSLRIHMDLVLLAARRKQRFTENVDEHYLPAWFWHHGDSHDPVVWQSEDCPVTLGL